MPESPFLNADQDEWICSNELAIAIFDGFPVSPGHALVVTRRIVPTWFDASPEEQAALMELVNETKRCLDETLNPKPTGYNVGFNCGETAGQTVMHVHVHVIPRYAGDVSDPRGGVRAVIPEKANYLKHGDAKNSGSVEASEADSGTVQLSTGHPDSRLWDQLSTRMAGAKLVDILASFVQLSGLDVIERRLFEVLQGEATIRILVSDYLHISDPRALARLLAWTDVVEADDDIRGVLKVRLVQIAELKSNPASFHPKAWRIVDELGAFVAVGSSNLSRPALVTGVEWSLLCTSRDHDGVPADFANAFDLLWESTTELSEELVRQYEAATREYRTEHFEPESSDHSEIPEPRPWQLAALKSLNQIRNAGYHRALVSVATGMGKTWLAAFDVQQIGQQLGRRPRVLVIAHRAHILAQAEAVLSLLLDDAFEQSASSWYIGSRNELSGDLIVASIQKLSRPEGLEKIANEVFDYVVIDEVHHAQAPTYRRVLAKLNAGFILGLTATPERTDGVDVVSIFDDNLAYHASIGDGIAEQALVPFHYIGIRDTVDFRQVPWRNGRFDQDELEKRVAASDRMERLWQALLENPGERTIVFCCSRRHALFARNWLQGRGVTSAAVFSGGGGDSYGEALEQLRNGQLETLCVVDMFNEGLDVPAVDRVVMLRPTQSKIVFLQQLGRGLRASVGKTRLLVIDFVGNHRVFAQRILHLLSLSGDTANWNELRQWLEGSPPSLPDGCLLDVELTARDVLKQFIPKGSQAGLEAYRALRDELGRRPTPVEMMVRGYIPSTISKTAGSWFQFANDEGDLNEDEQTVLASCVDWLTTVQTTNLNKSYKMVVLRALLDHSLFFESVELNSFAKQCRRFMLEHPILKRDLLSGKHAVDHENANDEDWAEWWIKWPISRWLDQQNGQRWFERERDEIKLAVECPPRLQSCLEAMTEELVDWRLAAYVKSRRLDNVAEGESSFLAKVSHSSGRPILFVPTTEKSPDRPVGPTVVQLPDGRQWEFKFVKVACNIANPVGDTTNQLAELLREWFGANAGLPGTDFRVQFEKRKGTWFVNPLNSNVDVDEITPVSLATESSWNPQIMTSVLTASKYKTHVPVYDLKASAGNFSDEGIPEAIGWVAVPGRNLKPGMFVAQVVGHSMEPKIANESWCLFAPCPAGSRQGKLVLVQLNTHVDPIDGGRYTIKLYHSEKHSTDEGWEHRSIELRPLNPDFDPIPIDEQAATDLRIIGVFVEVLS